MCVAWGADRKDAALHSITEAHMRRLIYFRFCNSYPMAAFSVVSFCAVLQISGIIVNLSLKPHLNVVFIDVRAFNSLLFPFLNQKILKRKVYHFQFQRQALNANLFSRREKLRIFHRK
jgi:hypothetical protein